MYNTFRNQRGPGSLTLEALRQEAGGGYALADLDQKDITPSSAYARLLAMVRDYADERGVSEAVAWPSVAQAHPELVPFPSRLISRSYLT